VYGARRKFAKKLCFESEFSFLSDFLPVNEVNKKICKKTAESRMTFSGIHKKASRVLHEASWLPR
jgi:hypothetical protein